MRVGLAQVQIFIPQSQSLKNKRQIVKGVKDKIRAKFNVSVAEVDHLDKWQRVTLAVAAVGNDGKFLDSVLAKVVDLIKSQYTLELVDYQIELF